MIEDHFPVSIIFGSKMERKFWLLHLASEPRVRVRGRLEGQWQNSIVLASLRDNDNNDNEDEEKFALEVLDKT